MGIGGGTGDGRLTYFPAASSGQSIQFVVIQGSRDGDSIIHIKLLSRLGTFETTAATRKVFQSIRGTVIEDPIGSGYQLQAESSIPVVKTMVNSFGGVRYGAFEMGFSVLVSVPCGFLDEGLNAQVPGTSACFEREA